MGKVVIVDDNDIELEILGQMMVDGGHQVIKLKSGHSIVEICADTKPVCILLDLMMPYKSGVDIYEDLMNDERTKEIPVIFVTASESLKKQCADLNKNADSFFSKPVKRDALLNVIKAKQNVFEAKALVKQMRLQLSETMSKLSLS